MVREYTKIQFRRDSSGNWISANPTLLAGEIGYETDTQKFKIGSGSLPWNSLNYANRPFVGNGLNYGTDGVVYADIDQAEFDSLDARVVILEADPTTKTYVDDEIASTVVYVDSQNTALNNKIDTEIADRQSDTTTLSGLITAEETARIAADAGLDARLEYLEDDIQTPGSIKYQIDQEAERAKDAEKANADDIARIDGTPTEPNSFRYEVNEEKKRAVFIEDGLELRLDVLEGSGPNSVEQDIQNAVDLLDIEDAQLQSNINAEEAARIDADKVIQDQVDIIKEPSGNVSGSFSKADREEREARIAGDNALTSSIQTETSTRIVEDNGLKLRLDTLEGSGTDSVEKDIQDAVDLLEDADAALKARLDTLEGSGDDSVEKDIQNAVDLLEDADDALAARLQTIEGNGTGSISFAVAEEAAIRKQNDDDLEDAIEVINGAGVGSITKAVEDEATRRNNADILLQGQIDDMDNPISGKADLVGGKVSVNQLPEMALSTFLGEVSTETNMLLLTGDSGDWCFRTDLSVSYIATGSDLTLKSNWQSITGADSGVVSVNNMSGAVTLTKDMFDVVYLETLSGVSEQSSNLGEFNGSTINDNNTIKGALAQLEAAVELKSNTTDISAVGFSGNYSDLISPPTSLSQFNNDNTNYITFNEAPVMSVAGREGIVILVKGDVGLGNVDNTSDANKQPSIAVNAALALKLDASVVTSTGTAIITAGSRGDVRTYLNVDEAGTDNSTDVTIVSGLGYLTISGQELTLGQIDLTTSVSGALPIANGGTGATTAGAARTALGVDAAGVDNSTNVTLGGNSYLSFTGNADNQVLNAGNVDLSDSVTGVLPLANGGTGQATLSEFKTAASLNNVENTSDANKPVSTATQTALDLKSDILTGAAIRTLLGIADSNGDPADGSGLYFDTSDNTYRISS